jgi:hypothetical protein
MSAVMTVRFRISRRSGRRGQDRLADAAPACAERRRSEITSAPRGHAEEPTLNPMRFELERCGTAPTGGHERASGKAIALRPGRTRRVARPSGTAAARACSFERAAFSPPHDRRRRPRARVRPVPSRWQMHRAAAEHGGVWCPAMAIKASAEPAAESQRCAGRNHEIPCNDRWRRSSDPTPRPPPRPAVSSTPVKSTSVAPGLRRRRVTGHRVRDRCGRVHPATIRRAPESPIAPI